jgi:hypothetical protein
MHDGDKVGNAAHALHDQVAAAAGCAHLAAAPLQAAAPKLSADSVESDSTTL